MPVDQGNTYHATYEVKNAAGAYANALTCTYTVLLPDQTTTAGAVDNPSEGHYAADYATVQEGQHRGRWATTGPVTSKDEWFNVRAYRSIIELDDARAYLGILDTSRDEILRSVLAGITRAIERHTGKWLIREVTERVYDPVSLNSCATSASLDALRLVEGPPLSAGAVTQVASLQPWGATLGAADVRADPGTGLVYRADGTAFTDGPWDVTYMAGRTVIPDDIIEGAKVALWDAWPPQRGVTADMLEPSLDEAAAYQASVPPDFRLSPRARAYLDGEHTPGFA